MTNPYKLITDGRAAAASGKGAVIYGANSAPPPILTRGVVVEVFYDMSLVTEEYKETLNVLNTNALDRIRRNCLLIEEIKQGQTGDRIICLPLLDPYISLPFKPGETVLVIREDVNRAIDELPYVLCRLPTYHHVDDVNYTHDDRKYIQMPSEFNEDSIQKIGIGPIDEPPEVENFENGQRDEESFTIGTTKDAYDVIWQESFASKKCVLEPVPRFTKLPGDQTLQGSNNNLINFTVDRSGLALDQDLQTQRGAIDIVVGRGYTQTYQLNPNTAPNIIQNSRDAEEVDKTAYVRKKTDIITEGNPDFNEDPSRIYVAMKTDIDKRFNININDIQEPPPTTRPDIEKPGIAIKTNQIRFLGREDVKIQADDGTGTGAAIVLKASGDIVLVPGLNGKIILSTLNPTATAIEMGRGATRGVARQDDTVAPNQEMIQWMTQTTAALTAMGALLSVPGPVIGAPGTSAAFPTTVPSENIGNISSSSNKTKSV